MTKFETWDEMTARHKAERTDMINSAINARLTQTQAAKALGIHLRALNNHVRRRGIFWPVKYCKEVGR